MLWFSRDDLFNGSRSWISSRNYRWNGIAFLVSLWRIDLINIFGCFFFNVIPSLILISWIIRTNRGIRLYLLDRTIWVIGVIRVVRIIGIIRIRWISWVRNKRVTWLCAISIGNIALGLIGLGALCYLDFKAYTSLLSSIDIP